MDIFTASALAHAVSVLADGVCAAPLRESGGLGLPRARLAVTPTQDKQVVFLFAARGFYITRSLLVHLTLCSGVEAVP